MARYLLIDGRTQAATLPLPARSPGKSIRDSVHKLLGDQVQALDWAASTTAKRSSAGRAWVRMFTAFPTKRPKSIKSFEGVDKVWSRSADGLKAELGVILVPTIRKDGLGDHRDDEP